MTTIEILNKVAKNPGYKDWKHLLKEEEGCNANITAYVEQAMQLYANQFITAADNIIIPAMDILPDTYKDELDAWFTLIEKVQDENND